MVTTVLVGIMRVPARVHAYTGILDSFKQAYAKKEWACRAPDKAEK